MRKAVVLAAAFAVGFAITYAVHTLAELATLVLDGDEE